MAVEHELRIAFMCDGKATVTHRCTVGIAGQKISHAEEIELTDVAAFRALLAKIVDTNRTEMESRTTALAIEHVAAITGQARRGVKQIKLGATAVPTGTAETTKG